jgi:flagellar biosynthesis protein FliR
VNLAILALRTFAAVIVLTTLVGGLPRVIQVAVAASLALWSALLLLPGSAVVPAWPLAVQEIVLGAALGVLGAVPLLAASAAGRLVDVGATGRAQGPYGTLFGVLAAAVFVGIDGHVTVVTALVESHRALPVVASSRIGVVAAIAQLVPAAVRLAIPWLVTAAVVQIAVGIGTRVAARVAGHLPSAIAVPAALTMMTASLASTLAITMAALMRGAM